MVDEEEKKEDKPLEVPEHIKQAREEREGMAKENDRREAILKREEDLEARRTLGGKSEGPTKVKEEDKETPQEYAQKILEGKIQFNKE